MRVGHAIEHQQQWVLNACVNAQVFTRGFKVFKQLVERRDLRQRINPRHHTLVAVAAAHLGQAQAIRLDQLDTAVTRAVGKSTHACITPLHVVEHFKDRFRRGFDADADGVKAEEIFGR